MKDEDLRAYFELLAKTMADQQILTLRMMAHQQAQLAAIRDLLVSQGKDRTMLNQQLRKSYQTAVNLFHDQLEAYQQSGDVKKLLDSIIFPDEEQSN